MTKKVYNRFERRRVTMKDFDKGRTQQHFKNEVSMKEIMKRYKKTGQLPMNHNTSMFYGDFTMVEDYQSALKRIDEVHGKFAELPSDIRKFFRNDPGALIDFVDNPANFEKGVEIGLYARPEPVIKKVGKQEQNVTKTEVKEPPEGGGTPSDT